MGLNDMESKMTKTRIASTLIVGVAAASALALAGCSTQGSNGGDSPQIGQVTVLCTQVEAFCAGMTTAFTADTGIAASYVNLGAGAALARLQAGASAPEFDVWAGGQAENHIAAAADGLNENYVSKEAANLPEGDFDPDGAWAGFYVDTMGFCSNKASLDTLGVDVPTSWEDLLNPALKGQISVADPATVGTGYMFVWTQVVRNDGDQEAAFDYLAQLNKNILNYEQVASAPIQTAGTGEIAVAIGIASDCQKLIDQGFNDLQITYPSEGTGFGIGAVNVVAGAPNPEGGKAFMDWILSADAQNLFANIPVNTPPLNPDAENRIAVDTSDAKLVDWDKQAAADARADLTARFTEEIAQAAK
jgi:iron(III) transport system substrate-binding protein